MDKYKINYIFNNNKDLNDILISVLNQELKNYIEKMCKNEKSVESSSSAEDSLKEKTIAGG